PGAIPLSVRSSGLLLGPEGDVSLDKQASNLYCPPWRGSRRRTPAKAQGLGLIGPKQLGISPAFPLLNGPPEQRPGRRGWAVSGAGGGKRDCLTAASPSPVSGPRAG